MVVQKPPPARRTDFEYQLHRRSISDPYRWMEDDSPELREWVKANHEYTVDQLASLPFRESIRARLEELLRAPARGPFIEAGTRRFYRQRVEGQELPSLYCELPGVAPILLIDPDKLSNDGSVTLADVHPSPTGSFIAYRLSSSGSSGMSLHVMDVERREVLSDVIPGSVNPVAHVWHTKNRVQWLPDNSGFYYTRCAENLSAAESRFHHKLYFHRLGDDWRDDRLVFGASLKREQTPYPHLSADGRLVVLVQDFSVTTPRSEVYLVDREDEVLLFKDGFTSVVVHRDVLYLKTNHEAPLGKLVAIDLNSLVATTVIREGSHPLGSWKLVGDYIFVETIENVASKLRAYDLTGRFVKEIELPAFSSITSMSAQRESRELVVSVSSFLTPAMVCRVDLVELSVQHEVSADLDGFVVEQVWFESRDGTRVPMFLVHKNDLDLDGNNAAVVHGYGGFGVSMTPKFLAHVIPFLESGGVYAVVNARGGGEFGEAWHRAGTHEQKQNVFDDFIAAAEYLIAKGYTKAFRLGCFGWSNGGLSVSAVAVQRPDLWRAVVSGAAVTDMARFHLAHGGRSWIADYGSPEDPDELEVLLRYSPYHNVSSGVSAPAVLSVAPDGDDRVAPWHSYKMHASWSHANISDHPILLRGEERAGHRGSPTLTRTLDRHADIWSFLFWQLGVTPG